MRLDPVYLAASEPTAERAATRRSFLLAGTTFVAGVSLGAAGHVSARTSAQTPAPPAALDRERRELRRLSTTAPLDELVDARFRLLHFVASDPGYDELLWSGVARLGRACLTLPEFPDLLVAAQWIARRLDEAPRAAATHGALTSRLRLLR